MREKYYVKYELFGEKEVTKEEWIRAERAAGFYPKCSSQDPRYWTELATGGFSSSCGISGSIKYIQELTHVVNLYKEPYDVYIGRAGKGKDGYFGNPFPLGSHANDKERKQCLDQYKEYFYHRISTDKEFRERVLSVKGKILGCFCKPKDCHGDIIAEWVDAQ